MAGFLTYGNKKFAPLDSKMREVLPSLYTAMKDLVPFVDHDAAAFSDYMVKTHTFSLVSKIKRIEFKFKLLQSGRNQS